MHTSAQKRLVRFSGVLLLSLLVVSLGVQAAQAAQGTGSGTSTFNTLQLPTLAQVQQHQGIGPYAPRVATAQLPTGWAWGANYVPGGSSTSVATALREAAAQALILHRHHFNNVSNTVAGSGTIAAAQAPASSGTSSTTTWIVAGSAAAALIVVIAAWALARRRRRPGALASATYCAQHPEDPLCSAT